MVRQSGWPGWQAVGLAGLAPEEPQHQASRAARQLQRDAVERGEVVHARPAHARLDSRTRGARAVAERGEHAHQVAAGRPADRADALRVEAVGLHLRRRPQPAHRGLHVVDRGRVRMRRHEPVIDGEGRVPELRELAALGGEVELVAAPPPAAVDHHDRRPLLRARRGHVGVERELLAVDRAVHHVVGDRDPGVGPRVRRCGAAGLRAGRPGERERERERGGHRADERGSQRERGAAAPALRQARRVCRHGVSVIASREPARAHP
jgi:hypothetical protein